MAQIELKEAMDLLEYLLALVPMTRRQLGVLQRDALMRTGLYNKTQLSKRLGVSIRLIRLEMNAVSGSSLGPSPQSIPQDPYPQHAGPSEQSDVGSSPCHPGHSGTSLAPGES